MANYTREVYCISHRNKRLTLCFTAADINLAQAASIAEYIKVRPKCPICQQAQVFGSSPVKEVKSPQPVV